MGENSKITEDIYQELIHEKKHLYNDKINTDKKGVAPIYVKLTVLL
jgi:hypothetical protein